MSDAEYSAYKLKIRQNLSLDLKIDLTNRRIREWYNHWGGQVYTSFSGGKDSTVLLDLVRKLYPEVPAVFVDTGLEYPEIRDFVKTIDNVTWLKPAMPFNKVIEKYGYPVVSKETSQKINDARNTKSDKLLHKRLHGADNAMKSGKIPEKWKFLLEAPFEIGHKCCEVMKKRPFAKYEKTTGNKGYVGIMAGDSRLRGQTYSQHGCNAFDMKRPQSRPLMFWQEEDIWEYIRTYDIPYSEIYDKGAENTGCMFCMFGVHMEKGENRFQRMARTHPKQYEYCINKLGCGEVLDYIGVSYDLYEEKSSCYKLLTDAECKSTKPTN